MAQGRPKVSVELAAAVRAIAHRESDPAVRDPDHLAHHFLGLKWRLVASVLRPVFMAVAERRVPGMYWFSVARTRHGDRLLQRALAEGELPQLVIIGAAYDSRALRFRSELTRTTIFDIDLPATVESKQSHWKRLFEDAPTNVRFLPLDLNEGPLLPRLVSNGYDVQRRTVFLFEGTSMFLPRSTVEDVLRTVAASPGAQLAMDYFSRRAIEMQAADVPGAHNAVMSARSNGEPLLFGLDLDEAAAFFEQCGLTLTSQLNGAELCRELLLGSDGVPRGPAAPFLTLAQARSRTSG